MSLRQRHQARPQPPPPPDEELEEPYNIIPIHNLLADHPSLRYPEVRAAAAALRAVGELRRRRSSVDGFHGPPRLARILLRVPARQRPQPARAPRPPPLKRADAPPAAAGQHRRPRPRCVRRLRKKLLHNYTSWCAYLGRKSNMLVSDPRGDLLYSALYLLVWGEAGNLRFAPECICYIYHHLAFELHRILADYIDSNTGHPANPAVSGEGAFLERIIVPFYKILKAEVGASRDGTAPHSAWRNYDDINEYFWNRHCFERIGWPINESPTSSATAP
ncbi:Callose synthase 12 [Acorus calamus]|uniref:Callose synthase 12 n=1 Tax=Acorus calamus TaxID=4465 RepID=A0AAV9CDJ8_ACOCL|nr:Callose synthase 12 [Acorus calamus]